MRYRCPKISLFAILALFLWSQLAIAHHGQAHDGVHEQIEACEVFHQAEQLFALPNSELAIPFLTPKSSQADSYFSFLLRAAQSWQFARAPPISVL